MVSSCSVANVMLTVAVLASVRLTAVVLVGVRVNSCSDGFC